MPAQLYKPTAKWPGVVIRQAANLSDAVANKRRLQIELDPPESQSLMIRQHV